MALNWSVPYATRGDNPFGIGFHILGCWCYGARGYASVKAAHRTD